MNKLSILKVDHNNLKSIPASIGNCSELTEAMMQYNFISHLPASIGRLNSLTTLNIDSNKLNSIPNQVYSVIVHKNTFK